MEMGPISAQPHTTSKPARPEKTPAGIRDALLPEDKPDFEADFTASMRKATDTYDLSPVHDCITRWWPVALLTWDDPDAQRQMMEHVRKVEAGEPVETIPWETFAEQHGLPA